MQLTQMIEKFAIDAQKKSDEDINELKENLAAEQKAEKFVEDEARRQRQMMVETNKILQKQLDDERDARLKAEIIARDAQAQFNMEVLKHILYILLTMGGLCNEG